MNGKSELVEHFEEFLNSLAASADEAAPLLSERELQIATAVLLVQALRADLRIKEGETEVVVAGLEEVLGLEPGEALALVKVAAQHARSSEAMRGALAALDRNLTRVQRVQLVEWLWRIAFADAELVSQEEYLIRKISDLLSLSTADLIEAKIRAKEAF
jgi:uncharacterized tellurite resistance protein B-like protein